MRLVWKKYDSAFNPVLTVVGVGFLLAGAYGMALLRHDLRYPIVLLVAVIPTVATVMGALIVVREVQLFRQR